MADIKEHAQIATKLTRIRLYRHSDGEGVRRLFSTSIASTSVGSPLRASLWIELKDSESILIYFIWALSIFIQLRQIPISGFSSTILGRGLFLVGTVVFWYKIYQVHSAYMKFIHRAVTTDLFDVAKSYGMTETEMGGKTGDLTPLGPNGFWVAEMLDESNGIWEIVGCTGIDISTYPDPDAAELRRMAVSSKCRRQGIASRLINTALDHAKKHNIRTVYLTTCIYNPSAVGLYLRFGWVILNEFTLLKKIRVSQFKLDLH